MKATVRFVLAGLMLGCHVLSAGAQNSDATPVPPLLAPPSLAPMATPPAADLANSWDSLRNYHLAAEIGFGVVYPHWGGAAQGPAFGTTGAVNVFDQHHAGFSVGWSEFNQSSTKSGSWSFPHRP